MKVCMICEGSYPYVRGGVSSWVQMLVRALPQIEFELLTLIADRQQAGDFKYELPENVTAINEIYLVDDDLVHSKKSRIHLTTKQRSAFYSFIMGKNENWPEIFDYFAKNDVSLNQFLMGPVFLDTVKEYYNQHYSRLPFTDFLWAYRSMMLPLFTMLKSMPPDADIFHSMSTGYSGVMASMAKHIHKKPLMITEHGIYTREREEDIIRSTAFAGEHKDLWIQHFYKMSTCAYNSADIIASLFAAARNLQVELGCPPEKTIVIPNGVIPNRFDDAPGKDADDTFINVGIIARISPIKDIKTLINSFSIAKDEVPNLRLYIMGGVEDDDRPYQDECFALVDTLGVEDIIFTGNIDPKDYIRKMDMIILTSISEGQPISLLEAMSAERPCIATKVGNCDEILLGSGPDAQPCGIIAPVMNVEKISDAIITLAKDDDLRRLYGQRGKQRVNEIYRLDQVVTTYEGLYNKLYDR